MSREGARKQQKLCPENQGLRPTIQRVVSQVSSIDKRVNITSKKGRNQQAASSNSLFGFTVSQISLHVHFIWPFLGHGKADQSSEVGSGVAGSGKLLTS